MNKMMRKLIGSVGLALVISLPAWAAEELDPQQVVMRTANAVLEEVTLKKTSLEINPRLIYPLVERTVVPKFDFESMTSSAMGRFWRKASDAQQAALINEFRELLVRTYATALLSYSGQSIEYPPVNLNPADEIVLIPTKIQAGGPPVPINYRLKRQADGEWKVYDVVIDGVSLVSNYRSSFTSEIRRGAAKAKDPSQRMASGIDSLIAVLASKNSQAAN